MRKIWKRTWLLSLTCLLSTGSFADSLNENLKQETMKQESIFKAIEMNMYQEVKDLVDAGYDLEQRNSEGQTPLMFAVYLNHNQIAVHLIQKGADVNAQDSILNSPFLYAGAQGNLEIVNHALKHGADFKVFNRYGGTALIPAAEKGHLEVVKVLALTPGFPINHVNKLGWTALMEAVVLSDGGPVHVAIIQELLQAGADPNIPDSHGVSALKHAKEKGFTAIVNLLEGFRRN